MESLNEYFPKDVKSIIEDYSLDIDLRLLNYMLTRIPSYPGTDPLWQWNLKTSEEYGEFMDSLDPHIYEIYKSYNHWACDDSDSFSKATERISFDHKITSLVVKVIRIKAKYGEKVESMNHEITQLITLYPDKEHPITSHDFTKGIQRIVTTIVGRKIEAKYGFGFAVDLPELEDSYFEYIPHIVKISYNSEIHSISCEIDFLPK